MKTLENVEQAQVEFFILIIRVPHDIIDWGYLKTFENEIIVYMNICRTHLKLKHKSNICDFEAILKTECNLQHLTRNFKIKNLHDFERDEADA